MFATSTSLVSSVSFGDVSNITIRRMTHFLPIDDPSFGMRSTSSHYVESVSLFFFISYLYVAHRFSIYIIM